MHVSEVRDRMVSITLQPCREQQTRHVTFADELQDALPECEQSTDLVVCDPSMDRQVEQVSSSEPQLEAVLASSHGHIERLCSCDAQQDESSGVRMDDLSAEDLALIQSFIDMLMPELDADSDCIGADFLVMQSFLDMLDSEHEDPVVSEVAQQDASSVDSQEICEVDMPGQPEMPIARDIYVDACSVHLAGSASVASAFGGLMYEMLISRPDIAAAVGAFAVAVISLSVTDTGIVHGGAMQVLCRYLQDVCGTFGSVWTYTGAESLTDSSAGLPHRGQPDAHDRQPVGIG